MRDIYFKHDNNGVFTDYSKDARDYLRDNFQFNFTAIEDYIYIGLYKPFNEFYVELFQASEDGQAISYKYNNGAFVRLNVNDDTKSMLRSGFISFEKPSDWVKSIIDGVEAYWIKLESDIDFSPYFKGVDIVYSDDNDLLQESRDIMDFLAKGDDSFIAYHVSARNDIVQTLRNTGEIKTVDYLPKQLTKWDLLDMGEVRQASKYLTLAKIFFDVSENVEDKSFSKYKSYKGMYGKAFDLFRLSIDKNDDGISDEIEYLAETFTIVSKQ